MAIALIPALFSLPVTDPVLVFALVMLIVLVAPLLFQRIRLPGIVGLIVVGAVVGPTGLGLLARDATMILLGTVGLLYLMFVAGLSIDLNQFERLRTRSIVFGLVSFFIPQSLAIVISTTFLGYDFFTALLVGSVVGSHTLLAYPIIQRLGIAKNKAITMAIGGTMMTDTLALTMLAIVLAAATGNVGPTFWLQFFGLAGAYVALVALGVPALARRFFKYTRNETNVEFVFLVALLFLTAYAAGLAGLAPIIGAFLAGLSVNRLVPDNGVLMSRVRFVGNSLLIPFFLISVGMLVDFQVLVQSLDIWLVAFVFTGLVVVGKLSAAKLIQRIYGDSPEEGWTVFGLTSPQAAATLAVTLVGFEVGLFDQTAVNAVVIMILATCVLGPMLVERYGRAVAFQEEARPYRPSEAPERILVPLANPATAEGLLDLAFLMRDSKSEQPIYPLTVVSDGPGVEAQVAASEKVLSHAVIHAAAADVPVTPLTRVDMNVAGGITRAITERRISTVVIGWNGEIAAPQRIFGSVLDQLLDTSRQMVLVTKIDDPINTLERVVVAFPPYSEREPGFPEAVRNVKTLASQLGADLVIVLAEPHRQTVEQITENTKPELTVEYVSMPSWRFLSQTLAEHLDKRDLLMPFSARRGSLAWRPGLDRLPAMAVQQLNHPNFVIVYPSEVRPEGEPHAVLEHLLPNAIDAERIVVGIEGMSAKETVERLVIESNLAEEPARMTRVVEELMNSAPKTLPEIVEGLVLFHAHSEEVQLPKVFIGISHEGLHFHSSDHLIYVVLLLLTPTDYPPENHLHTLSTLADMFRAPEVVTRLRSARDPEDVLNVLADEVSASRPVP